jgi:Uma2 family endonuclease
MATIDPITITTADQLFSVASQLGRCELVRGELIMMSPAGGRHGVLALKFGARLEEFVSRHALGTVVGAETGFVLQRDPDTVRAPDAAFLRAGRFPDGVPVSFIPGAPDLAVEVLSPEDRPGQVHAKVRNWLESGCEEVWVVDPRLATVAIHCQGETRVLNLADSLTTSMLPGFSLPLVEDFQK